RRGETFVTRKITRGLANIAQGLEQCLYMGNIDSLRDWGHAKDYVRMQWMMLQQDVAEDFVIATGETHSVREFCEIAFSHAGLNYKDHVTQDPRFMRPAEVDQLIGDATKAETQLGWKKEVDFPQLVKMMVDADIERWSRVQK
ncbi:MAG: GDP-mannose 4,6-dehydratase, partial [Verrucomicrobiota bacterium]